MKRDRSLPVGTLPLDAQRWLKAASEVGAPGSIHRRVAIDKAYRRIEDEYPQYLKQKD